MKSKPTPFKHAAPRLLTLLATLAVPAHLPAQPASSSLSGRVLEDLTGNGQHNNKEHGLDGWVVFLDLNGDGVLNNPEGDGLPTALAQEPWAITDNQGNFQFSALGPGRYPARIVPRAGWTQTTSNPAPITAHSGQTVSGLSFGLAGPN